MRIVNGNSTKAGSQLPNMSETIKSWFQPISFGVVQYGQIRYEKTEVINLINTNGVVQPYKPEPLEIQMAGIQTWIWQMIHCEPNLQLKNGDYIYYKGIKHKVLFRSDYSEYGYMMYIVCEAFDDLRRAA